MISDTYTLTISDLGIPAHHAVTHIVGGIDELSLSTAQLTSGTLPVVRGGTGAATLTGYVKGTGTTAMTAAASVPVGDISGTLPITSGGTGAISATGSGILVLATAPSITNASLTTPSLGIPTSGSLINCTNVRLTDAVGVTGILPVTSGGTGVINNTGSGLLVLSDNPTLQSPALLTPDLGTPTDGNLQNCTGLPLTLGAGVTGILPIAYGGTGTVGTSIDTLSFDKLKFKTTSQSIDTLNTGEVRWNSTDGTLDLRLSADVTLQVGQETNIKVQATANIANGQVVFINGGTGTLPTVALADYSTIDAKKTLGVATQSITSGSIGYITVVGLVRDLNLITLLGSPIANGETVWLGASGTLTKTEPPYPYSKVRIGHIVNATNSTGIIHVNVNFDPTGTVNGTGKIGYGAGSGGTVTQITSKSTSVLLNKTTGQITMHNEVLNHNTIVSFTLDNNKIEAGDVLILNHISGGTAGIYLLNAQCASGSATINVKNTHISAGVGNANNLGESIVIAFAVIKAVTA